MFVVFIFAKNNNIFFLDFIRNESENMCHVINGNNNQKNVVFMEGAISLFLFINLK
jgi:hypothetical protein